MPWYVRAGLALATLVALVAAPGSARASTVPTMGTVQGTVTTRLEPMLFAGTLGIGNRSYQGTFATTAATLTTGNIDPTHVKYFVYNIGALELSGSNQMGTSVSASCSGGTLGYEEYLLWSQYESDMGFGLVCTGTVTGGGPPSSGSFHLDGWMPVITGDQYRPDVNPGRTDFKGTYGNGAIPYTGTCQDVPLILTCNAQ